MTDPFNSVAGGGADPWQNLMAFGLSTMQAGAQPGAKTLGAIGQGGLSAMDFARQNALARTDQQYKQSQITNQQLENAIKTRQVNIQNAALGLPQFDPKNPDSYTNPTAAAPSSPPVNSTGMPFSPTAGMSVRDPSAAGQTGGQPQGGQPQGGGNPGGNPFGAPGGLLEQLNPQEREMYQRGYNMTIGGMPEVGKQLMETATRRLNAQSEAQGKYQYEPVTVTPGSTVMMGGKQLATGAQDATAPDGSTYRIPARIGNPVQQGIEQTESGGNPNAVSPAGARGPMQIMPGTQASPGYGVAPARDGSPEENRRVGTDYLNALTQHYGNPTLGMMAYNWGPGNVDGWMQGGADPAKVPTETRNYVGTAPLNIVASSLKQSGAAGLPPGAIRTGVPSASKAYMDKRGSDLAGFEQEIQQKAQGAAELNYTLDNMNIAAMDFKPNSFGDFRGKWAENMQSFVQQFSGPGSKTTFDEKANSYAELVKNSETVTRQLTSQVSSNPAAREMDIIRLSRPGANTPGSAFNNLTGQMQALNDWQIAQEKALEDWKAEKGTPEGFLQDYKKNVSPAVFMLNRMSGEDFKSTVDKMSQQPNGKKVVGNLFEKVNYAKSHGLIQ